MADTSPVRVTDAGVTYVRLGGSSYRLNMPTLGQFQELKQRFEEANDRVSDLVDETLILAGEWVERAKEVAGETADGRERPMTELTADERAAYRQARIDYRTQTRELQREQVEAWLVWWDGMFAVLLGDSAKPARDSYEPWMANSETVVGLLNGWQFNPLARGV